MANLLRDPEQTGVDLAALGAASLRRGRAGSPDPGAGRNAHPDAVYRAAPLAGLHEGCPCGVLVDRKEKFPTQDLNALANAPEQFLYPGPLDTPPDTEAAREAKTVLSEFGCDRASNSPSTACFPSLA